ncbi:MAG TPA: hypothetical protein VGM78_02345 [Ilumatobacteraceae bacterium]
MALPLDRPATGSRTYGGRKGRMSPTRQRALDELVPRYAVVGPVASAGRLIVEIGCGKGDATAAMAPADAAADAAVIACEANQATIANLARLLDAAGITNVALWVGDAFDLLAQLGPSRVDELRIWFPDPWPKPRHAGKRLVTPNRVAVLTDALVTGGRLRLATDASAYADQALSVLSAEPRLAGEVVARPAARPITPFEARGLRAGHAAIDLEFRRIA